MYKKVILLTFVIFFILFIAIYFTDSNKYNRLNTIFNISLKEIKEVVYWKEKWIENGNGEILCKIEITKNDYNRLKTRININKKDSTINIPENIKNKGIYLIDYHTLSEDKVLIKYTDKNKFYLYCYYGKKRVR